MDAFGLRTTICQDCGRTARYEPYEAVFARATPDQREGLQEGLQWVGEPASVSRAFLCPCGNLGVCGSLHSEGF